MTNTETTETTQTPQSAQPSTETVARLRELATEIAWFTGSCDHWIENELPAAWSTFLVHALSQTGMRRSEKYDDQDRNGYYTYSVGIDGITYAGPIYHCGESEDHQYTIPWAFIDPAARPAAEERILAELRDEKIAEQQRAAENARKQAEHQRQQQVKQLEALAASLGKKIIDE